jgi:DNA modification methylase
MPKDAAAFTGYTVILKPAAELIPYARNARTHSDEQIAKIMASIREWGWTNPCLADGNDLVAGHGRTLAALRIYEAGQTISLPDGRTLPDGTVPVIDCHGWSEAQRRAYVLADNALAEQAAWDKELFRLEFGDLVSVGFDTGLIGFEPVDLGKLLAVPDELKAGLTDPDDVPDKPKDPVTRPGDVWLMGPHRLVCGDATDADVVGHCLNGIGVMLMVTDPPYGVDYKASWRDDALGKSGSGVSGEGRATGEVRNDGQADWREAYALFPGPVAYVWHAGNKCGEVADSLTECGFNIRAQIIWAKNQLVISRGDYHPQHEPCFYAVRKGAKGHWSGDRKQTTLWEIDKPRKSETGHSTQKPVECMRRPMENNSAAGQPVYDPFMGSGTSIIAAEQIGRVCLGIELNPAYCDVAVLRWQDFTGENATLEATGQTFTELLGERVPEAVLVPAKAKAKK